MYEHRRQPGRRDSSPRLKLQVGKPWPEDGIDLTVERPSARPKREHVVSAVLGSLVLVLLALTGYGMATSDGPMLEKIFDLVRQGLLILLAWAIGRRGPSHNPG